MPPDTPAEGGGATTFEPGFKPMPLRLPRALPLRSAAFVVGGGATLSPSVGLATEPAFLTLTDVEGGGATSAGPKIFPIRPLMNDPPAEGDGGGGTTAFVGSGAEPGDRWRISAFTSVEGGGATFAGAGSVIFGLRIFPRSGADTGGGTTAGSIVCSGADEYWRRTEAGAGGTTFAASEGPARNGSR